MKSTSCPKSSCSNHGSQLLTHKQGEWCLNYRFLLLVLSFNPLNRVFTVASLAFYFAFFLPECSSPIILPPQSHILPRGPYCIHSSFVMHGLTSFWIFYMKAEGQRWRPVITSTMNHLSSPVSASDGRVPPSRNKGRMVMTQTVVYSTSGSSIPQLYCRSCKMLLSLCKPDRFLICSKSDHLSRIFKYRPRKSYRIISACIYFWIQLSN